MLAMLRTLRAMTLSVARIVDGGGSPTTEAAMVKELATRFEQECLDRVDRHLDCAPRLSGDHELESLLARALLVSPSWTIRGGTTEIMRSIVAKDLMRR